MPENLLIDPNRDWPAWETPRARSLAVCANCCHCRTGRYRAQERNPRFDFYFWLLWTVAVAVRKRTEAFWRGRGRGFHVPGKPGKTLS